MLTLTGAGAISVEASQPGNGAFNAATPVDVSFNVAKANQSIAFTPVQNQSAGGPPFALAATASSGLPVYFNIVSGPAVLSGNVITVLGSGTVAVNAWQPGDTNYNAAATVQQSFGVSGVPQTITFGPLSIQQVGDAPFDLNATSDSGLPISFSVVSGPAIISGNTLIITGSGTVTILASQSGDGTYGAASGIEQSFSVNTAKPGSASRRYCELHRGSLGHANADSAMAGEHQRRKQLDQPDRYSTVQRDGNRDADDHRCHDVNERLPVPVLGQQCGPDQRAQQRSDTHGESGERGPIVHYAA
jgi:hypothetical protein